MVPESRALALSTAGYESPPLVESHNAADLERLQQLWRDRIRDSDTRDYPIGPGDVLEIAVPAMEEISTRTVRVSGEGTIELPFVGEVHTTGLTEEELSETIRQRLKSYMHHPRVALFVREYRSRQVAVIGAVDKPGLYSLASGGDTVLEVVTQAGGLKEDAAPRLYLLPAEPVKREHAQMLAATLPAQFLKRDPSPLILKTADPIEIDLQTIAHGGASSYLSLPVRPGDVIIVPGGGEVLVQGWVEKPASYKITPGLTVLGAIAAAGGPHFAANTSAVRILRAGKSGEKIMMETDLEKVKIGERPDIAVQDGDVVEVTSSSSKLVPYGVYHFFSTVFRVGATIRGY
ncbi:MAG: polysaccharide biosynthesis/export family protein [Candidatus Binatia bacterium]